MATTPHRLLTKTRLIAIAVFLVLALIVPLTDPDYFWHLKAGEYIVAHRTLPGGDIFSFTRFGQPWVLHEWLFEVLLFAVFSTGGPLGVQLLMALFVTATLGVTFALARRIGQSHPAAWMIMLCAVIPLCSGIAPRPQLVTYLCFALYLTVLLNYKYRGAARSLLALPLLMVLWVNAHGGYVVGIALVCLFSATEWLNYWLGATRDPLQRQRLVRLSQAAGATILASLLNPGFIEHWLYPFQVLGMAANQHIQEWQSPNFRELLPRTYLLLCALFMLSYLHATPKADLTELLIPGFFLINGFISGRHVPLAALTLVPFIALALARGGSAACLSRWRGSALARLYARSIGGGRQLDRGEGALNWTMLATLLVLLVLCAPAYQAKALQEADKEVPAAAADFVIAKGIQGNMFNNYNHGGYLIWRLAPQRKVFIDGRADVYGDQFFADYRDIYGGKADWREKFDRFAIDFAILNKDAPIRQLLLADGSFEEAYHDGAYSVLLRKATRRPALAAIAN